MENTKVVVMGANDVAAMRKAHKEAEAAYFEAKVGALEFVAQECAGLVKNILRLSWHICPA